jgi:hypothetical protein
MDKEVIKAILETENGWIVIILFLLYFAFNIGKIIITNKKAKTREQLILKSLKTKDGLIESTDRRLKILSDQYNADLSKEAAMVIIQNIYYNFYNILLDEIDTLRKKRIDTNRLSTIIESRVIILNDDKMHELELFLYRGRELITFTSGDIIDSDKVLNIVNSYADKNGMLANELKTNIEMEMNKIIKRLS